MSKKEFDGRQVPSRIRLNSISVDTVNRLCKLHDEKNVSMNKLLNELIEVGLPMLERKYHNYSNNDEENIINQQNEVIQLLKEKNNLLESELKELRRMFDKKLDAIRDELTHINATVSIQEYINSSTYEHLKFFLNIFIATQGAGKMSEELSRLYDNRIAEQFLEKKIKALSKFLFKNDNVYLGDKEADEKLKRENEIKYKKNKALYDEIVNKKI